VLKKSYFILNTKIGFLAKKKPRGNEWRGLVVAKCVKEIRFFLKLGFLAKAKVCQKNPILKTKIGFLLKSIRQPGPKLLGNGILVVSKLSKKSDFLKKSDFW
jgi:hypothetical protein